MSTQNGTVIDLTTAADFVPLAPAGGHSMLIPVDLIDPNPNQPRQDFDPEQLGELAASITEHGVIQPIVVEPWYIHGLSESPEEEVEPRYSHGSSTVTEIRYILHDGERRLRAAKLAGLTEIPAYIVEPGANAQELLIRAVVANVQRSDLSPIELAKSYQQLADQGLSDAKIAKAVGKSRSAVANARRLLNLPIERQQQLADGKLSERQALALVPLHQLPAAVQKRLADDYNSKRLLTEPEKYTSDEIREKFKRAILNISVSFDLFKPDDPFAADIPGIVQPTCPGCVSYVEAGPACLDAECFVAKSNAYKIGRLEEAHQLTGCGFIDPDFNLPWDDYSQFYSKNDLILAHAQSINCPNLRLRYTNYKNKPIADGVDPHILLICHHPNKKKCACEQSLKAGDIAAKKAKEQKFAQIKQTVASALAAAIQQQQPAGLKAIAIKLNNSKKLKSDDPAYLCQHIANTLADGHFYYYDSTSEAEYQKRVDDYLASIGLTLGDPDPVIDLNFRLERIGQWVKLLRSSRPDAASIAGNLSNLAQLANEAQALQDRDDQARIKLTNDLFWIGLDQLKTALLTLQPLFPDQASYIEITHVSWLLTVPAGDINFKHHLSQITYPETLDYALALADLFQTSKTALDTIHRRRRQLEKNSPADIEAARSSYINGIYPNTDPAAVEGMGSISPPLVGEGPGVGAETQLAAIAAALENPDLVYSQLTAYKNQLNEMFAHLDVDGAYDHPTQLALISCWEDLFDRVEQRRKNFTYRPLNL